MFDAQPLGEDDDRTIRILADQAGRMLMEIVYVIALRNRRGREVRFYRNGGSVGVEWHVLKKEDARGVELSCRGCMYTKVLILRHVRTSTFLSYYF